MESMSVGYPPEDAGKISITATREEWRALLKDLSSAFDYYTPEDISIDLMYELKKWGVDAD